MYARSFLVGYFGCKPFEDVRKLLGDPCQVMDVTVTTAFWILEVVSLHLTVGVDVPDVHHGVVVSSLSIGSASVVNSTLLEAFLIPTFRVRFVAGFGRGGCTIEGGPIRVEAVDPLVEVPKSSRSGAAILCGIPPWRINSWIASFDSVESAFQKIEISCEAEDLFLSKFRRKM